MKKLVLVAVVSMLSVVSHGQTLFHTIGDIFNVDNTNGVIHADELNASFGWKRDADNDLNGGVLKIDWWATTQQGAFFSYEEFGDQSAYWSVGYQARTVFKKLEFGLGTGVRQNVDESFGDVNMFLSPYLCYHLIRSENWNFRLTAGADIIAGTDKPNPYVNLTFTFYRF